MRFQILHRSPGRLRLRACVRSMTTGQADLLEAWLLAEASVERVVIQENIRSVTVCYRGDPAAVTARLAAFSEAATLAALPPLHHSSRAMNREYKEKLVGMVVSHFCKRWFLPAPVRATLCACESVPRILTAVKTLWSRRLTVDVLDGAAIGVSQLTGDFATASSVMFLLRLGETLEEWTHKRSVEDLARSMALQVDSVWRLEADGRQSLVPLSAVSPGDLVLVHTGHVLPLDGILEQGDVMLNQASLTGESVPVAKRPGAAVYAGSVVEEGNCMLRVTGTAGENRYDRIVRMIEDSERLKSGVELQAANLADRLVPWCIEAGKDIEGKGYDPRKLLKPGCEAIVAKAKELAEGFEAAGKAN